MGGLIVGLSIGLDEFPHVAPENIAKATPEGNRHFGRFGMIRYALFLTKVVPL
jgi:hypothetical protein